ncbi:DUF1425 domain-containing protein [Shewanella sp. YIC-542]|uniref:DUF1425 domain-containing protein n=1 Tax=Shewanella mytili TaxID=3377111 RepID=UPI00398E4D3A
MKTAGLIMAALLTLGACVTNTAGIYATSQGAVQQDGNALKRHVSLDGIKAYPDGGQLSGYATLRSHVAYDQHLQYRVTWYDANDNAIDGENMSWTPVTLHGFQHLQLKTTAPNRRASWFGLHVREIIAH